MFSKATPTLWQTRSVEYGKGDWSKLRPDGKAATCITQQFGAEVIAQVWGDDDAQAEANARLIVTAVNEFDALVEALETTLDKWIQLAESGDAGFWNPYDEQHVIDARAVLARINESAP